MYSMHVMLLLCYFYDSYINNLIKNKNLIFKLVFLYFSYMLTIFTNTNSHLLMQIVKFLLIISNHLIFFFTNI